MSLALEFLNYSFLTYALLAILILGPATGVLSPFIVSKRYAFLAECVAHSTLLSSALALMMGFDVSSMGFFMVVLVITYLLVAIFIYIKGKGPTDSSLALFLISTLSLGVLLHFKFAPSQANLSSYLFGNILLVDQTDLLILYLLGALTLLFVIFKLKKITFFFFDPIGFKLAGHRSTFYQYFFIFLLTSLIVAGFKIVGTLLITSLFIIPGHFAVTVGVSMKKTLWLSVIFSTTTLILGLILSHIFGLLPGATLALTQFITFAILRIIYEKKMQVPFR